MNRALSFMGILALLAGPAKGDWLSEERLTPIANCYLSYNNARSVAASANGDVHVVWFDDSECPYNDCYHMRWDSSDTTWSDRCDLSYWPHAPAYIYRTSDYPSIAVGTDGSIHTVWSDLRDTNYEIYWRAYQSYSWGLQTRLTVDDANSLNPSIISDGLGDLHLVWMDDRSGTYEIFYKKNEGGAWGPDTSLTQTGSLSTYPCISSDSYGNMYIVWQEWVGSNFEIYFKERRDGTWGATTRLTFEENNSNHPQICVDPSGLLHLVWQDDRNGAYSIFYKRYDGGSWTPDASLVERDGSSMYPCMVSDPSGRLHLVWADNRDGDYEIYYKKFDGSSWSEDTRLSFADGVSTLPAIASDGLGNLLVLWEDRREADPESPQIYSRWWVGRGLPGQPPPMAQNPSLVISPNPFGAGGTTIQCEVQNSNCKMSLRIYDLSGRLVRTLVDESSNNPTMQPSNRVNWDGRGDEGGKVGDGVYLCQLTGTDNGREGRDFRTTKKLLILR